MASLLSTERGRRASARLQPAFPGDVPRLDHRMARDRATAARRDGATGASGGPGWAKAGALLSSARLAIAAETMVFIGVSLSRSVDRISPFKGDALNAT